MSQLAICLIIFAITIIGYCSGKYSLATIAITSLMTLTLTGCLQAKEALGYFANSNVIMIAGMCIVAAGFNRTKFCTALADRISVIAKGSLAKMMMGYVLIGVLLSQFVQSPVSVIGIVAPMLIASAESMGLKPSKVIFPVGIATIITCCTLPLGAGATIAGELNGYLESYGYTDFTIGFLDPMIARLPLLIIASLYCIFTAVKLAPDEPTAEIAISGKKKGNAVSLNSFQEAAGIFIFFADAVGMMFASKFGLALWQVTVIGALAMVLCGVLKPKEASAAIPLSMLLLIVGALAISGALSATGAGELIGAHIANMVTAVGGNSYLVGLIFFVVPFILTQFMSNRGTMMIFYPIAIATCSAADLNPTGLMILIQAACLSAFMTPMATSGVGYIMGCGGYDQKSMIKQSIPLAVICCVVSVGWIMTMFPLK